jgi:hypothetical protein
MPQTRPISKGSRYTPQRVADMLAVVMWTHTHPSNKLGTDVTSCRRVGPGSIKSVELPFVAAHLMSDARSELAQLDSSLLLAGFEIWAERQRAVVRKLAESATDSQ